MNSIAFSTLFHIITWNLMLKLSKLCNKYSGNTYALVEIQLNICRNTIDFMCDLEPFSEIRSQICNIILLYINNFNTLYWEIFKVQNF